jgi:penicillin-binding protein activator
VIVDGEFIRNESAQAVNKNAITDRLRVALNRAAKGRMAFVGRHYAGMVAQERDLKRQGVVDVGTVGLTQAQAGGDYRLGGNITSIDSRDPRTGMMQRYNQITFEMVDLERGTLVWTNQYEFSRAGQDDVVYR